MSLVFAVAPAAVASALGSDTTEAQPVCVSAPKAKLRASPSTSAKVNWTVGRYMPLEQLAKQNGWSQVRDFRGQTHWVITKNITTNDSCAVVRVRTAPLREGPGNSYPRAEFQLADRYTPFRKVDREGNWVRLEDGFRGSYWTQDSNVWIPVKRSRMAF